MTPSLSDNSYMWDQRLIIMPQEQAQNTDKGQITSAVTYFGRIFWFDLYSLSRKTLTDHQLNIKQWIDSFLCRKVCILKVVLQDWTTSSTSPSHWDLRILFTFAFGHTWRGNNFSYIFVVRTSEEKYRAFLSGCLGSGLMPITVNQLVLLPVNFSALTLIRTND